MTLTLLVLNGALLAQQTKRPRPVRAAVASKQQDERVKRTPALAAQKKDVKRTETGQAGQFPPANLTALQEEDDPQEPTLPEVVAQEPTLPEVLVRPPTFIEETATIPRVGLIEESIFNSPQALTVVGQQELLERAPRTPAEALRYKPGIWIQKTGHRGGAPILRGFMGNRVIYNFDGIRRNTASLFGGPNGFLQNIDALDIDRIEVIRGPGSVLYGSDAIGGVINVQTNEQPRFSEGGVLIRWSNLRTMGKCRSRTKRTPGNFCVLAEAICVSWRQFTRHR